MRESNVYHHVLWVLCNKIRFALINVKKVIMIIILFALNVLHNAKNVYRHLIANHVQ